LANPRSPEFSLQVSASSVESPVFEGSLGAGFAIFTWKSKKIHLTDPTTGEDIIHVENKSIQLAAEAAAFITFTHQSNTMSFPLIAEDFVFSLPVAFQWNNFVAVARYTHNSAHLGDGSEEESFAYSREILWLNIDWYWSIAAYQAKSYIYGGTPFITIPRENNPKWFVGVGQEFVLNDLLPNIAPYFATDFSWDAEKASLSSHIGIWIPHRFPGGLSMRVAVVWYIGRDPKGQRYNQDLNKIGVGMFIR